MTSFITRAYVSVVLALGVVCTVWSKSANASCLVLNMPARGLGFSNVGLGCEIGVGGLLRARALVPGPAPASR